MLTHVKGQTQLPSEVANAASISMQGDEYGSLAIRGEEIFWSEQGLYYKACNSTPGTGIAMGIQTTFSDTANVLLLIRNSSTTKKIIPHYIRLINTAVGASTTSSNIAIATDTANRYTSGGTDLTTQVVNTSSGRANTTAADQVRFGAITASAVVARRIVARCVAKTQATPCFALGDEFKIVFGTDGDQGLLSGSAAARYIMNVGPLVLEGQNHCLLVHMWNTANATTAPSWEVEMAWWER